MTAAVGRFRNVGPSSQLNGVSNAAWQHLVAALEVQSITVVSPSGGLGAYDMRPRRLVELGYATNPRTRRQPHEWLTSPEVDVCRQCQQPFHASLVGEGCPSARQITTCDFVLPWTKSRFLLDPMAQYAALTRSISTHHQALVRGEIAQPAGVSVAGALAILHVGGRGALSGWPKLFDNTRARYEAAHKAF